MADFDGFEVGETEGILGKIIRELNDIKRWKEDMQEWKVSVSSQIEAICSICGAQAGDIEPGQDLSRASLKDIQTHMGQLQDENEALRLQLEEYKGQTKEMKTHVEEIKEKHNKWVNDEGGKVKEVAMKEIMEEQKKQSERENKDLESVVVNAMRRNEQVLRETIDRNKCIIVFGDIEEHIIERKARDKEEINKVKTLIKHVDEEGNNWRDDIEEVRRMGKYSKGNTRPMRVQFRSRVTVDAIMNVTWRLNLTSKFKKITIRKDMSIEDRNIRKELQTEANVKNGERTKEDEKKFFWRVWEGKLKKWYIKRRDEVGREREMVRVTGEKAEGGEVEMERETVQVEAEGGEVETERETVQVEIRGEETS